MERAITPTRVAQFAGVPAREEDRGGLTALGSTIRRLRRERGLSLRELGGLTGFSISFLALVERGRSSISLTSLYTVAVSLGVDMSVFFPAPSAQPEAANAAHVNRSSGDTRLSIGRAHRTVAPYAPTRAPQASRRSGVTPSIRRLSYGMTICS